MDRDAARPRRRVARFPGRADGVRVASPATVPATVPVIPRGAVLLLGMAGALVVSLARLIDLLPTYGEEFAGLRADASRGLRGTRMDAQPIHDVVERIEPGTLVDLASGVLGGTLGVLSNLVFLVAVLLFLCFDAAFFPARLAAAGRERPLVVAALRSFPRRAPGATSW